MTQTQVNIKRLVDNIKKTNAYTPLVEAIANSIDAINEANPDTGKITVTLFRSRQGTILKALDDELLPFDAFSISDNGVGINDKNLESFNTIYSENKIREGGKGFGRFVYLKYFTKVSIESTYSERGESYQRGFDFVKDNTIIQNQHSEKINTCPSETTISLLGLKPEYLNKIDKKVETISRKLLEKLLVYFVIDGYTCPIITIKDAESGEEIILNNLLGEDREISKEKEVELIMDTQNGSVREKFKVKIFKLFYGENRSSINLVADKRLVTESALHTFIPEFKDDFYDLIDQENGEQTKKNFTIKTYVQGKYLDEHVCLERDGFEFSNTDNGDLFFPLSQKEIEKEAANLTKNVFGLMVKTRQDKKEADIKAYVDEKAPWHKSNFSDLDLAQISYNPSEEEIESALEQIRFNKESKTRKEVVEILATEDATEVVQKADALIGKISDIQKNELAHYVALRRAILDIFKKSLNWNEDMKYQKEKVIHDIIFPTRSDSDTTPYNQHNLWLLDEKLSFTEYISSDKPLNSRDERPDLLIFDNKIVVREGDTASNPIIVFEFKKPQRTEYAEDENPLKQIADYVKKVREGNFKDIEGRNIYATDNTPAFGFLVCDLTEKIKGFCNEYGLVESPDMKGYFGFHSIFKIYYQVISFDKLVEDAELRNKIFFKHLGIQ